MMNRTEEDEREYLDYIKLKLLAAARQVDNAVKASVEELRINKEYIYEHQSGMDEADMVAAGQSVDRIAFTGESVVLRKRKLLKLSASPYFGRIDFKPDDPAPALPVYIGMYSFIDQQTRDSLIYDWRAPISSMFYDFEMGNACYGTPSGQVCGEIVLKRQYRITDGKMEFMIENAVSIHDEVLQQELSRSSDDKMKNIVATIQRDQNMVIRNETARVIIIQGVAGSGKTSIALHRVAFLLYRFRESISAQDVLIISPNKVFASYISSVLPELGEEHIPETGMEEIASAVLEDRYRFQTFFQQVSALLERHDDTFIQRIQYKATFSFLSKLNQYLIYIENNYFTSTAMNVSGVVVPHPYILERFRAYHRIPLLNRFALVARDIQQYIRTQTQRKISGRDKSRINEAVPRMFRFSTLLDLYKDFFRWNGEPQMFRMLPGGILEYADVFPLAYFKIRLEGAQRYDHVKHLLIDEMQDYTPVQYAVISRLFNCKKTILGDVSQRVNPYSSSASEIIEQVFPHADIIKLNRSYRSTIEIIRFAQQLVPDPDLEPMERHGAPPVIVACQHADDELTEIKRVIARFYDDTFRSMGIICKTDSQARSLHEQLQGSFGNIHLLSPESAIFSSGVIITTTHLSKGLEFDEVIIPMVTARNYHTTVDKSMLYIACTRAMHRLTLTHTGERSPLLK